MRALFDISRWPAILVLAGAGLAAVVLAFATLNLFVQGMANLEFLRRYGWRAVEEGALRQLAAILGSGLVALFAYLAFKFCETELSVRYRAWMARGRISRAPPDED